ncbi:MAG: hypothetical protein FJY80_05160 [Candidatus Aminicenantes bacterium]|nr:hypothetical protein [Candidatus Aminicenantes bacterium]
MKRVIQARVFGTAVAVLLALGHGASAAQKVPITFNDYHGYTGTVAYLKAVAQAYPDITELLEIGRSNMGRTIYVLVITNRKTGTTVDRHVSLGHPRNEIPAPAIPRDLGKPGQYIDGGTHGNEYTGTEVCLYIIDKLVSGYGSEPDITRLVDTKVFYVNPVVNPDGVFNSVEREMSQRGNSAKRDDDGDGRVNEDGPDDLNGDGHLTQFRHKDPKGTFVLDDKDPRLMVRLGPNEQTSKARYSVVAEDKDNDGDGRRGEDGEAGFDVNRNFPEGWWTDEGFAGGTGDYPTSSPEAQALVEFGVTHRNILMVQNFHTSGGFTYRVPGTAPDSALAPRDVAVYDLVLGKKYLEIIGEKVPDAWLKPELMADFKAKLRGQSRNKYALERGYEMPRGWVMGYNEAQDRRYGYGMVIDWWFQQFGAYAVTTELWNPQIDIPGFPKIDPQSPDSRNETERALLRWNDEKYGGKLFVKWTPWKHPELGDGEVGGWIPKYRSNALPGEPLLGVCEKHWQFEKFRAGLLPDVQVTGVQAKVLYRADNPPSAKAIRQGDVVTIQKGGGRGRYALIEVTATVENLGPLATHVARGATFQNNREDVVWLVGDRAKVTYLQGAPWQRLGVLDGTMKIPGVSAGPERSLAGQRGGGGPDMPMPPAGPAGKPPFQMGQRGGTAEPAAPPQAGTKREVKWLVAVEGGAPLKVVASSQKGGTSVRDVVVK